MFLPLHLKQTFPPIIWIFTEDEGDGIESRLPFKIFSTLKMSCCHKSIFKLGLFIQFGDDFHTGLTIARTLVPFPFGTDSILL